MNCRKKKHKGTRTVKKYATGGVTGDPKTVKELLARLKAFGVDDSDWFDKTQNSLANSNAIKDFNSLPLSSYEMTEADRNKTNEGDWAFDVARQSLIPESASMQLYGFEDGPISSGPPIDLALALGLGPMGGAAAINTGLTALGEAAYPFLEPIGAALTAELGVAGVTVENIVNAGFASHGVTNGWENIKAFVSDPSWAKAGDVAINLLEILPAAFTGIKNMSKLNKTNSVSPSINLLDDTAETSVAIKEVENTAIVQSHINASLKVHSNRLAQGLITQDEFEVAAAKTLLYQQERMSKPGYLQHIINSIKSPFIAEERLPSGMPTFESSMAKQKGVSKFGYHEMVWNDVDQIYDLTFTPYDDPQTAYLKMIDLMTDPEAGSVLKAAVRMTQKEIGDNLRGLQIPSSSPYWEDVYKGSKISYLENLSPEELLNVLVHEDNHARRVPFMEFLTDNWAVAQFTMIGDIRPTQGLRGVRDGIVGGGTELANVGKRTSMPYRTWEKQTTYMLEEVEVAARVEEIQQQWWLTEKGKNMDDWIYKWTPELAEEAYINWNANHPLITLMRGQTDPEKFQNLANLMNNMLAPAAAIVGTKAAVEAVADPQVGATKYNTGGFVANKKRPRGMNIKRLR